MSTVVPVPPEDAEEECLRLDPSFHVMVEQGHRRGTLIDIRYRFLGRPASLARVVPTSEPLRKARADLVATALAILKGQRS